MGSTIIRIASGITNTTISTATIPGYTLLTIDNFNLKIINIVHYGGCGNGGETGNLNFVPTMYYNANAGILTISNMKKHSTVEPETGHVAFSGVTIYADVYVVY